MKGKNLQPRLLYLARISFRFDRKSKALQKIKAKRIQHHQTSSTTNAKRTSLGMKKEKEKTYKNKPKTIKKMVTGTYISIITLNVKGLNAPTKTYRLAGWIQNKTKTWRLNNTLLNNQEIIEEIKEEVKKCLEMINQDGRVEGRALTLSCENTRIATGR